MNRRDTVLALTALGAASGPLASVAQQGKVWRIGMLSLRSEADFRTSGLGEHFLGGMRDLGYVEGRNLALDFRFADGKPQNLPRLVRELLDLHVDIIVAAGNQAIAAAQSGAPGIPIVIATSIDPVGSGFVKNLARPGGNITGLSNMTSDVAGKQLELISSVAPKRSRIAFLENPTNSAHAAVRKALLASASSAGIVLLPFEAGTPQAIADAFERMAANKAGGVIVAVDGFFSVHRREIATLALRYRIASVFTTSAYVDAGGLMSYGQNFGENYRRAAAFVDKILRGARPTDLPIEQSTKFELVLNRATAKALGITLPAELLLRADRVIE